MASRLPDADERVPRNDGWEIEPYFLVLSDDREGVAAALDAASRRFMNVTAVGERLPDGHEERGESEEYTPNGVSGVRTYGDGLIIRVNTKGFLTQKMGIAMIEILTDELGSRDLNAIVTGVEGGYVKTEPWRGPGA